MDVVRLPSRSNPRSSLLPALPVAVAALVICATQIGLLGTAVVAVLAAVVLIGGLRLYAARVSRVNARRAALGVQSIVVDASWNGKAGKATISPAGLQFSATRGEPAVATAQDIQRIELAPVRAIIRATRAKLSMTDGSEIRVTFTAAIDDVSKALGA